MVGWSKYLDLFYEEDLVYNFGGVVISDVGGKQVIAEYG
jgi:hypothetical protein